MNSKKKLLSGAEIIIECLKEQGVDTVFGYPGGTVLAVYDALYRNKKSIRHILTSHEEGAAHAADGYSRATGKTGVCLVTSGPGATNIVTGIATAYMDSVPMVAITINVSVNSLGKDSFQEVDIAGITMPVTKHSFIVKDITRLADTLRRAFKIACSGRKGPVLVDITRDVTLAKMGFVPECTGYGEASRINQNEQNGGKDVPAADGGFIINDEDKEKSLYSKADGADSTVYENICSRLNHAKRPVLLVGGGCIHSNARSALIGFTDRFGLPVVDTLMGKGAFPGDGHGYLGMLGRHGTAAANAAVEAADLLIAVGTRFSDRVTGNSAEFAKNAFIIQADIDKAEINKNVSVDIGVNEDASDFLKRITALLKQNRSFDDWIEELRKTYEAPTNEKTDGKFHGAEIVSKVYRLTEGRAIICTEVGQNQMLASGYFKYGNEGQLITSGGLGTMGFGLGAAIGAKIGCPDRTVINFAGDGCFRMNMNELLTAVRYRLPIIEIVIDNSSLGMVRQMQEKFYAGRLSETVFHDNPDFEGIAATMGARAYTADDADSFERIFIKALSEKTFPTVIVCHVPQDDTV